MATNSFVQAGPSYLETCPVTGLLKYLEKVYGAIGDCLRDDNGYPKCMFFQDSFMKDLFNFYPDRVCIDYSFKKLDIDLHMLIFLCEDSNGRNYIVAVGFLQHKDDDSLAWLLTTFRKHNPNWRKIRSLAVDPGIQHWELVKEMFSSSFIIICSYHAVKEYKSHVTNAKAFKLVAGEHKNCAVNLFESLLYAPADSVFEIQLKKYHDLPKLFVSYLFEVWWPHKLKWRIPLDFKHEDVFECRNKYLEELNNAVQMIFESEKNYVEFIKKLFLMILLKKREKPSLFLQPVTFLYSRFSPEYQICKTLTPYAARFVIGQLDLSQEMTTNFNPLSEYYTFDYLDMEIQTCATSCQCNFYLYTLLPCRHIFCVRKTNYFCLFDSSNVDYTWNMQYYKHASMCMQDYLMNSIDCRIPQDIPSRTALASHLFEITTPILLDSATDVYESRIKVLKNLLQAWKMNDDVSLTFVGIQKCLKKDISQTSKHPSFSKKSETVIISEDHNSTEIHISLEKPSEMKMILPKEKHVLQENYCSEMVVHSSNTTNSEPLVIHHEPKRASRQKPCDINDCLFGKHINLAYVVTIICLTKESCVNWLKTQGFLPTSMKCYLCQGEMISKNLSRLNDGVAWRCPDKKCMGKKVSVRVGTWFEESNLTLHQMLIFTYMWLNKFTKARIILEMSISASNYVKWDKFHRRVCEESLNVSSDVDQPGPSSYEDPRDKWIQNQAENDTFLQFLKDAAEVCKKDKERNSLGANITIN